MSHRPLIYAAVVLLTLIWGTTWGAITIGLEGFPPLKGVAARFLAASLLLLFCGRLLGWPLRWERRLAFLWPVQALLTFALPYGLVYWGEQWVPSGLTSVLFATLPLFVALFASGLLPEERLGGGGVAGILLGFAGVGVIFSEDLRALGGPEVLRAAPIVLVAPLASAVAQVVVKRWGRGLDALTLTAVPMGLCGLLAGAAALLLEAERPIVLAPAPLLATLYLTVAGTAITFSVYFWLLSRLPATRLSLIAYATPVVAVLLGTLVLDEPLTLRLGAGAVLVIGGVALTARPAPRGAG